MTLHQFAQDAALTWQPTRGASHIRPFLEAAALSLQVADADKFAAVCAARPRSRHQSLVDCWT